MSKEAGITLIEVLIATFIVAVLSSMGVAMLDSTLKSKDAANQVSEAAHEVELARAVLKSDLAQITARRARDIYGGDPRRAFSDTAVDARVLMSFVRNGRETPAGFDSEGGSSLQYVEYRFEEGALIRRSRNRIDATPQTPFHDRVLLSDILDVAVEYYRAGDWVRTWPAPLAGGGSLDAPPALAFVITTPRFGEIRTVFLTPAGL